MRIGRIRAARFALPFLAVSVSGCPGGGECNLVGCNNQVTITATVPPIGASTWTVTVCDNDTCLSGQLSAAKPRNDMTPSMTLEHDTLTIEWGTAQPSNGDVWSVTIVDDQGQTIFDKQRAVTYDTYEVGGPDCASTCYRASISLN